MRSSPELGDRVATSGHDFVRAMQSCFRRATLAAKGMHSVDVQLGTARIRLNRAGAALDAAILPAFSHRVMAPATDGADVPELEVRIWDSSSTGVFAPQPPWTERDFLARGEVRHDFDGDVQLSFRIDSGVLSVFDTRTRIAYCWVRDAALLPPWEIAAPLRPILAWWAAATGRQLAHGASVGTSEGAVLLAARGGSGKSTTALSALERGMLYLGDDYVLLESPEEPQVASLYCAAKLYPENLEARLPRLAALIAGAVDPSQDKVTLALQDAFAPQLAGHLPLRAIVVPQVGANQQPWLEPISPTAVLAALAPTTVLQLPGAGGASLARMGSFAATLPGYRMHLSPLLDANIALLRDLIRDRAQAQG